MTFRAVGFGRGFPRAWLLPIGALTVLLGIAASGRLSRSIVADLIAWWPVWLGLAITAYLLRERRIGSFRVAGLVPIGALVFIGLFTWGHLAGWSIMPSASQRLVGPDPSSFTSATLIAGIDGEIEVSGDSNFLYQVAPIMRGGRIGIPDATEAVLDTMVTIDLEEPADPGLYSYAGWDLKLSPDAVWSLDLSGAIDADLTTVAFDGIEISGAGTVDLGEATIETPVNVGGSFRVSIPAGSAARVVGTASIPSSWTLTDEGATTPGGGTGWLFTVVGDASLTIVER
ncbi:MAG TPA: hypothetical protein VF115_01430 [Acidimicrobiia bacterium]